MNKEELIRNLKYTEKKHRNDTVNTFDTDISMMCVDVLRVLKNCIEIPDGATIGDVVKAIFPCMNVANDQEWFIHLQDGKGNIIKISKDLWDSPYRKVEE